MTLVEDNVFASKTSCVDFKDFNTFDRNIVPDVTVWITFERCISTCSCRIEEVDEEANFTICVCVEVLTEGDA